jgi:hypothetical protein
MSRGTVLGDQSGQQQVIKKTCMYHCGHEDLSPYDKWLKAGLVDPVFHYTKSSFTCSLCTPNNFLSYIPWQYGQIVSNYH